MLRAALASGAFDCQHGVTKTVSHIASERRSDSLRGVSSAATAVSGSAADLP
jgi:hypothetical protein